jgi:hypothetical protein
VLATACVEEGCPEPVRAKDRCARHYFADYARQNGRVNGGPHRPPLDTTVYKIRYRRADGASNTTYYSDPKLADAAAVSFAEAGQLIYYGRYALEEEMTSHV